MSQVLVAKGLGGATVLGGIIAGRYVTYEHYFGKTIEQVLNKEGLTVLTSTSTEDWKNVISAYQRDDKVNTENGFISQLANKNDSEIINKFIDKCKEVVLERFRGFNEDNFRNAVRWCTGEQTINGVLTNLKLELIERGNHQEWKKSIAKIKNDKDESISKIDYNGDVLDSIC